MAEETTVSKVAEAESIDNPISEKTIDSTNTTDKPAVDESKAEAQKIADAMVAKKLKGMPTKEELKAFKDWQDTQKTTEQKQQDLINAEKLARTVAEQETNTLKATVSCLKQGVNADSVDDVVALAQRLVSDSIDIDTAIKTVVEKYPLFKAQAQSKADAPKVTTGTQSQSQTTPTKIDAIAARMGVKL
ncbi:MAG: hypothetical protein RSA99_00755 [Oscillospiraceae bacterium]